MNLVYKDIVMNSSGATHPLVAIKCLVFNHEPYLRQCLDGFVMQQTKFPFVAIVHDDASTDRSADIIREYAKRYPDIIRPIYETENQYSKGTLGRVMDAAVDATGAKYIALCEGDDYWTAPDKLQKQVDFLESHPDYSMCANATQWLMSNGALVNSPVCCLETDCDIPTDEMVRRGGLYINLTSIVYRRDLVHKEDFAWWCIADVGDYPLCIAASLQGKVHCLADKMSVYRYECQGSWTSRAKQTDQTRHFLNEYKWLRLFDKETNHRYRQAVYEHLFPRMIRTIFKNGELSLIEYITARHYSQLHYPAIRIFKDIVIHYLHKKS